jgi:hypothetical protein
MPNSINYSFFASATESAALGADATSGTLFVRRRFQLKGIRAVVSKFSRCSVRGEIAIWMRRSRSTLVSLAIRAFDRFHEPMILTCIAPTAEDSAVVAANAAVVHGFVGATPRIDPSWVD